MEILIGMSDSLFDLKKMDPMARRATAALEALTKAIETEDRLAVEKHLDAANNAMALLREDLNLYDSLNKAMPKNDMAIQKGVSFNPSNTDKTFSGGEEASALGVVRAGRTDKLYRPHTVY